MIEDGSVEEMISVIEGGVGYLKGLGDWYGLILLKDECFECLKLSTRKLIIVQSKRVD